MRTYCNKNADRDIKVSIRHLTVSKLLFFCTWDLLTMVFKKLGAIAAKILGAGRLGPCSQGSTEKMAKNFGSREIGTPPSRVSRLCKGYFGSFGSREIGPNLPIFFLGAGRLGLISQYFFWELGDWGRPNGSREHSFS